MVDNEIRRKKKFDGDEDPIVTAQRFLNVFHQLHIFNEEKKNEFNTMILKQPQGVLSMLNTLPGGGMLLDYVEELQQKSGIATEHRTASVETLEMNDEVSKAKILATALAEAPSPQYVQQVSSAPSKVEMGADFTKDLASAIAQALANNNNQQKDDIRSFVQTLGRAQLDVIKLLREENNERKQETIDLSRMLNESQQKISDAIISKPSSPTISTVETNQAPIVVNTPALDFSELIKVSQQQTNQILLSLNESRRADNVELAKVLKESQLEIAKMLIQNNTIMSNNNAQANNNANNIQINTDSGGNNNRQLEEIITKLAQMQSATIATTAAVPQINFDMSGFENMLGQLVSSQSQLYREMATAQTKELSAIISLALKESQAMSVENIITAIENLPQPAPAQVVERIITLKNDDNDNYDDENTDDEDEDIAVPVKKKKKRKKKKNREEILLEPEIDDEQFTKQEEENIEPEPIISIEPEDEQYIYVEAPMETTSAIPAEEITEPEPEPVIEETTEAETETNSMSVEIEEEVETPAVEMAEDETILDEEQNLSTTAAEIKTDDVSAEDWGWNTPIEEDEIVIEDAISTMVQEWEYEEEAPITEETNLEQDWEWEYEEVKEENLEAADSEQDWVWEYEEVMEENNIGQPIDANSPIYSHELVFQTNIMPTPLDEQIDLPLVANIAIKNLEKHGADENPYQDYEAKD